ncbi:MAG: TIGR04282 family arsenosugar biosynthesis glycosyltransferase [Cellvibrionaceae bacterium]
MYNFPDTRLLVFSKSPEKTRVKTRMQPVYSQDFSVSLHKQLVNHCLSLWAASAVCPIDLWLAGSELIFKEALPSLSTLPVYQQQGNDLGERMCSAAKMTLKESEAVLLVGTDCPFIDEDYLISACESLQQYDLVISPATDGGYVLLGFKQLSTTLFNNINWGSSEVFQQTLVAINKAGLSYKQLPTLSDIDRPEDIELLTAINGFEDLLTQCGSVQKQSPF